MTATTLTGLAVLAAKEPAGEASKSGPWGLAIILLLCLACYFLFKSMSRHMRKVREQFPTRGPGVRPGSRAAAPRPPAQPGPPDPQPEDQPGPDAGGEDGPPAAS